MVPVLELWRRRFLRWWFGLRDWRFRLHLRHTLDRRSLSYCFTTGVYCAFSPATRKKWNEKQAWVVEDDKKLEERRAELETQTSALIDRMKMVSSETVIKRMDEEVVGLEKQITELQSSDETQAKTVDIEVVLKYARYLAEHLPDTLLHLCGPLRKAAFFGAIFNRVPSYEDLIGGIQKQPRYQG